MAAFAYRCTRCSRRFRREQVRYLCPVCGKEYRPGIPLVGVLEAEFDPAPIRGRFRRSRPDWNLFCAVEPEYHPPLPVGRTPFFRSRALERLHGLDQVWVKNDGANPSGSLKDRASFLVVAEANRVGEDTVVAASTGNAASALAAVCASAGKRAVIFVPKTAPKAKLVQMILYGASVVPVDGSYDDAFRLSLEYTARHGGLNRNTAYHPLTIEGKKTVGFEIWEQNGFEVPGAIVVPTGDGVILSGVHKAFVDLRSAGLIRRLPRLVCVQASRSDAIDRYFRTGRYRDARNPKTVADSISVSIPSNAHMARNALLASRGITLRVTDREILLGQRTLASETGVFAEPAAAAAAAALPKLAALGWKGSVVVLATGHGLKDVDAAMTGLSVPQPVSADESGLGEAARRLERELSKA